ncbi:MAG: ROK family protein [Firmicutes bacterium]|nr:ROK family protein [Bacillota bacterium]
MEQRAASAAKAVLAVDIGGTKIAAGVVTPDGRVLAVDRMPTLPQQGPASALERLRTLVQRLADQSEQPLAAIGIGSVGPIDVQKGTIVEASNLPDWHDVPLTATLSEALHLPAFLANDANAAALGEYRFGAGQGAASLVYLTASTGIGGGVVIHGKLLDGTSGNGFEIGHTTLVHNGRPCGCGNFGCLEAYASGSAIAAFARQAVARGIPSVLTELADTTEAITAVHVAEAVRRNDPLATTLWYEAMEALGAGVATTINLINPDRVVIGGGLTHSADLLFPAVRRATRRHALKALADIVEIVPAALGDRVGILGAAAVALHHLQSDG